MQSFSVLGQIIGLVCFDKCFVFISLCEIDFVFVDLRLRTLLKTAKKRVRDQDAGGAEFGSPMSSMRMDLGRHTEGHLGRMKDRVCPSDTADLNLSSITQYLTERAMALVSVSYM